MAMDCPQCQRVGMNHCFNPQCQLYYCPTCHHVYGVWRGSPVWFQGMHHEYMGFKGRGD